MKRIVCSFFALALFTFLSVAQAPQSVFDQLVSINMEWKNQKDADPLLKEYKALTNLSEVELIQAHLSQTEKLLRARSTSHLSASQRKNRAELLDILHDYRLKGVFPKNTFHKERRPYFIDIFNTYCAVGYLMSKSGADAMARDINRTQNYSYLRDIKHPQLTAWVRFAGFTVDELALIQPGYDCLPTAIVEMHYDNQGPDINEYIEVNSGSDLYNIFDQIEFYDHLGVLYKTILRTSLPFYIVYVWNAGSHVAEPHPIYFYNFPSNESFADSGSVKLTRTGFLPGPVITLAYNANGVAVTRSFPFSPSFTYNYTVFENGNSLPGSSLNFCSYSCSDNFVANILPATYGNINNSCLAILPLQLQSFNYSLLNNKVQLTWTTASEVNTDRFEIERSTNGTNFSRIGSRTAAVNSSVSKSYDFLDPTPGTTNYYRLKQVDRDGKSVYSKILLVKLRVNSPLILYSTIAGDNLRVGINLNQQEIQSLKIFDLAGRFGMGVRARSGLNEIDISKLPPGVYFIRLETKTGGNFGERLIKQ